MYVSSLNGTTTRRKWPKNARLRWVVVQVVTKVFNSSPAPYSLVPKFYSEMSRFAPHKTSASNPRATQDTVCQKCLGRGHFTYNCKSKTVPYKIRPSRTQMLENPDKYGLAGPQKAGGPSVEVPAEFLSKLVTFLTCLSCYTGVESSKVIEY